MTSAILTTLLFYPRLSLHSNLLMVYASITNESLNARQIWLLFFMGSKLRLLVLILYHYYFVHSCLDYFYEKVILYLFVDLNYLYYCFLDCLAIILYLNYFKDPLLSVLCLFYSTNDLLLAYWKLIHSYGYLIYYWKSN